MPRSLDPTLLSAMNSGSYNAIIRAWGCFYLTRYDLLQVLSFKLHLDELELKCTGYIFNTHMHIQLERGCLIAGTEYTIFSSMYYVDSYEYHLGIFTLHCKGVTPIVFQFTVAADSTYEDVVVALTEAYRDPLYIGTPAWLGYKVLPAGRSVLLQSWRSALTWLRQKYLVYCTDYDPDYLLWFSVSEAYAQASSYTLTISENDILGRHGESRRFLWRDEANTVHYSGSLGLPIHNLGYLESTDSPPAFPSDPVCRFMNARIRVPANLKYLTSDTATFNGTKILLDVTEVFDPKASPAWYMDLESLPYFANTEGGSLPSTIEAAAPYTPLNVSTFNCILDSTDNNIQAAMQTIDDHSHVVIMTSAPSGAITGKYLALNTTTSRLYVWTGAAWVAV